MNDYEVTVTFKVTATSDDSVYDILDGIFKDNEDVFDLEYDVEQLTWAPELLEEVE
jgi:hypothetical protein